MLAFILSMIESNKWMLKNQLKKQSRANMNLFYTKLRVLGEIDSIRCFWGSEIGVLDRRLGIANF